ncbi:hypothetical protein C8R46DRAFT_661478 [Mycena filopes]|nr:hypothetical protein C8R46DRAFT_661478 [Mycena filopes]
MDPYNPYLNHHWPPPLMVLDAEVPLPLELPKAYSAYAGFRRRLWSTWKLKSHFPYAYESLWLWEEEDEQYLQEFIDQHWKSTRYVPDWAEKTCSAFETHRSQSTTFTNPLAHLTSQTRLRFIVWLHLRANTATLVHFIKRWARFLSLGGKPGSCKYCGALEFLDIWVETLRAVYSTEHMLSIAWDYDCSCLTKCLNIIHPMLPPTPLTTDSPVLPALYRIIIPPWPLILWMAFRASNDVLLPKFLEIIRDPIHQDVVGWDSDDLFLSGVYDGEEYPHNWIPYLVEIELTDWLQIRDIAGKDHHFDDWNPDHSAICIVAALIIFSPSNTLNASDALPLRLRTAMPKGYPLHSIARVINKDYESTTDPANFASKPKEFWTGPNLESWVATRRLELCHVAWVQSSRSVLERLEFIHEGLTSKRLPQVSSPAPSPRATAH